MELVFLGGALLWIAFVVVIARVFTFTRLDYYDERDLDEWQRFQEACANRDRQ